MDLEGTPLQIKTDSKLDSYDQIRVWLFSKDGTLVTTVTLKFSYSSMRYYINYCSSYSGYADLPVQPPVEVNKIWTITKTETALIITCNEVEVLNYLFADSSDRNCVPGWGGDVKYIDFYKDDRASDFYRAGWGLLYRFNSPHF